VTRRIVLAVALGLYLVFVGFITLDPAPPDTAKNPVVLWITHVTPLTYGAVEFLANIAMFVPIGVLVTLLSRHCWMAPVVGLALTCAIEITQMFLPARFPDLQDVFANTLGAVLGSLAVAGVRFVRASRARKVTEESPS
jgi:glycopeptide antibiotics resistance protein